MVALQHTRTRTHIQSRIPEKNGNNKSYYDHAKFMTRDFDVKYLALNKMKSSYGRTVAFPSNRMVDLSTRTCLHQSDVFRAAEIESPLFENV